MQIRCIETDVETWWLMGEKEKGGMGVGVMSQYPISHLLPQELEWAMKAVIAFSLYLNYCCYDQDNLIGCKYL